MADTLFIVHFAGKALTFIKEKVLTWESGMRRGVPKVLVVVTDGRSQDEVRKAATVIQHSGKQFTVPGCFIPLCVKQCNYKWCISYLGKLYSSFMDSETYSEYLGKTQNYLKNLYPGPDVTFSSSAFFLRKDVASQGFQVISHAYHFTDVTFGYFFLSLLCGRRGSL